jgi:hypothetical protein
VLTCLTDQGRKAAGAIVVGGPKKPSDTLFSRPRDHEPCEGA